MRLATNAMPIEIRELVIRTTVVTGRQPQPARPIDLGEAKREIIAACLEAVSDKLERPTQR